ncbi:hypothetical protein HPB48_009159 [Haemaphysalis longicornis]|uniref:Ribosome assembly factor mrt4 n=1 Tax=Haemaphysalis longicornis TaxID=44386 RepID=A0A9J6GBY0_HAELO|nr:hypothetical protein HPB48_009159 [Haemaphysalis longicornis]
MMEGWPGKRSERRRFRRAAGPKRPAGGSRLSWLSSVDWGSILLKVFRKQSVRKRAIQDIGEENVLDYVGVRDAFNKYDKVFVYSVSNMRNTKLKDVRQDWKDSSRFYFGKNKVMAVALGRFIDEDHRENLHQVSERLRGQCGLFFTNAPRDKVLSWFGEYEDADYARAGFRATQRVFLDQGPLPQFQHSLEPHLRRLGLPTSLQKGG